jgi:hypothetical protein
VIFFWSRIAALIAVSHRNDLHIFDSIGSAIVDSLKTEPLTINPDYHEVSSLSGQAKQICLIVIGDAKMLRNNIQQEGVKAMNTLQIKEECG